jgi:hypothetical protein
MSDKTKPWLVLDSSLSHTAGIGEANIRWVLCAIVVGAIGLLACGGDSSPPLSFTLDAPADGQHVGPLATINGTISGGKEPVMVEVRAGGGTWQSASIDAATGTWNCLWDTSSLPEDVPVELVARAVDAAGQEEQVVITVVPDHTPPDLTLIQPEENLVIRKFVAVQAESEEAETVDMRVDSGEWQSLSLGPNGYFDYLDLTSQPPGALTLTVRAVDRALNETLETRTLYKTAGEALQGPPHLPKFGRLAVTSTGEPVACYYDADDLVRFVERQDGTWPATDVATEIDPASCAIAVDGGDVPYVFYRAGDQVFYATADFTGAGEPLPGAAAFAVQPWQAETDGLGRVHLAFAGAFGVTGHAVLDATGWTVHTVPSDHTTAGAGVGFALDAGDDPHLAYPDHECRLIYAPWDGASFQPETVTGPTDILRIYDLVLDTDGEPAICVGRSTTLPDSFEITVLRRSGAQWTELVLGTAADLVSGCGLAVAGDGQVWAAYARCGFGAMEADCHTMLVPLDAADPHADGFPLLVVGGAEDLDLRTGPTGDLRVLTTGHSDIFYASHTP